MNQYKLKVSGGEIPLEWGTWAMHRFCELNGENGKPLPLARLMEVYSGENLSFTHVIKMIQAAAEAADEKIKPTEREVGRWIDECGGLNNPEGQILGFIRFTVNQSLPDIKEDESVEKKS